MSYAPHAPDRGYGRAPAYPPGGNNNYNGGHAAPGVPVAVAGQAYQNQNGGHAQPGVYPQAVPYTPPYVPGYDPQPYAYVNHHRAGNWNGHNVGRGNPAGAPGFGKFLAGIFVLFIGTPLMVNKFRFNPTAALFISIATITWIFSENTKPRNY